MWSKRRPTRRSRRPNESVGGKGRRGGAGRTKAGARDIEAVEARIAEKRDLLDKAAAPKRPRSKGRLYFARKGTFLLCVDRHAKDLAKYVEEGQTVEDLIATFDTALDEAALGDKIETMEADLQ